MKVYHCGASSEDAGKKITTITHLADIDNTKTQYAHFVTIFHWY